MSSPASFSLPARTADLPFSRRANRFPQRAQPLTVATSLLGLRLIDDNYLHPEPGRPPATTSRAASFRSRAATLAAAACPRLTPAPAPTTASSLGMFALLVGS